MKRLTPVIQVIDEKCVNCHACIAACPVKYCNDGSGEVVRLNADTCIGCGACITTCTHEARVILDDTAKFLQEVRQGTKMVAVVAPSIAASFPEHYLNVNGWLKSLGVEAVFDVSFGAELTVTTYLEHVKQNQPRTVIAQPCPAIVSYIQLYRPELLPYLAPADSPMLHTIRMIREYYPQYRTHKVAVISPCIAKRREFDETGLGDYNVTFANLEKYFREHAIRLNAFPAADYDNPPAERAVLFSTPGGLLRTAAREVPEIVERTRKIEGSHVIYKYLDELPHMIREGKAPLLVDCLNCELGCNGGTGTSCQTRAQDDLEWQVEQRSQKMRARYADQTKKDGQDRLHASIDQYWKPGLYARHYDVLADNITLRMPTESTIQEIYRDQLKKETKADELNCGACGYGSCHRMAIALHNGLSQLEHCAMYKEKRLQEDEQHLRRVNEERLAEAETLRRKIDHLLEVVSAAAHGDLTRKVPVEGSEAIDQLAAGIKRMLEDLSSIISQVATAASQFQEVSQVMANSSQSLATAAQSQSAGAEEVTAAVDELTLSVQQVRENADQADKTARKSNELAVQGGAAVQKSIEAMHLIRTSSDQISEIIQVISEIAKQTNMLALNAAIEAARAGQHGLGFAVVADEVRKLAERSNKAAREITALIKSATDRVQDGAKLSEETGKALTMIIQSVTGTADEIAAIAAATVQQASSTDEVSRAIQGISASTEQTAGKSQEMAASSEELSAQAIALGELVSRFKTGDTTSGHLSQRR